jgi:DNA modification methylase
MYERLVLMRELLSDTGSIYLHCDWHKSHHLRMLMDEVFGINNFMNEIVWSYKTGGIPNSGYARKHDTILFYIKTDRYNFSVQYEKSYIPTLANRTFAKEELGALVDEDGCPNCGLKGQWYKMSSVRDVWEITALFRNSQEREGYPTQKPEAILERIIKASSNPGDIVFDCFMGSGTTQAVAMKLGRRFIGADINLGAIQTTTKRLLGTAKELNSNLATETKYTGFEVYNVNNYDFFRNPVEAKELLIDFFEMQPSTGIPAFDGEKDGRMVKIMPTDRICCRADLGGFLSLLPYKAWKKKLDEHPEGVTEKISLYCMGHEPDLRAVLQKELSKWNVDVEVFDILREKKDLELKRDSEADITIHKGKLVIKKFYPMNLMQKLSLQKTTVKNDWRILVESVMIDFNYDGAVLHPSVTDIPAKNELVKGEYEIPKSSGTIRVKITDLLSESLELELENG